MILILIIIISLQSATALRINEVMYNPKPKTDAYNEWIEIYNENSKSIDLENWSVAGTEIENITLPKKSYMVLSRKLLDGTSANPDSFESVWGNDDGSWNSKDGNYTAIESSFGQGLSNTGDQIKIKNKSGKVLEKYQYGQNSGADGNGKSLQFCEGNWKPRKPTPGNKNNCSTTENNSASNNTENNQTNPNEEKPNNTTKNKNDSKNKTEENISLERNGRPNSTEKIQKEETESKKQKDKIVLNNQQEKTEKEKTKDIKKDNNSSEGLNKGNFAKYGIGAFTILIGLLMILKSKIFGKKRKNEFQD